MLKTSRQLFFFPYRILADREILFLLTLSLMHRFSFYHDTIIVSYASAQSKISWSIVTGTLHSSHRGDRSFVNRRKWKIFVWSIRARVIETWSLRVARELYRYYYTKILYLKKISIKKGVTFPTLSSFISYRAFVNSISSILFVTRDITILSLFWHEGITNETRRRPSRAFSRASSRAFSRASQRCLDRTARNLPNWTPIEIAWKWNAELLKKIRCNNTACCVTGSR